MATRGGPTSLEREISPPPSRKTSNVQLVSDIRPPAEKHESQSGIEPTLAAIEAGQARIRDHLEYFTKHLSGLKRPSPQAGLSIDTFRELYKRNQHAQGRHFVVHQHDHPISGVHYDLRLQFSETSTVSFAIPYGLPGNANSKRPNRMAIETRVHNLWNNLIESASHATGSLLIWDTGQYEVLRRPTKKARMTDDELSEAEDNAYTDQRTESERLIAAFRSRHIHLRLHGTRLPKGYTIALRLPADENPKARPRKPKIKRRRMDPTQAAVLARQKLALVETDSDESATNSTATETSSVYSADVDAAIASDEGEDAEIRTNNAYPGSTNTIGSIHQRHWFLTLDRKYSGFHKARSGPDEGRWVGAWEPFYVRGRDYERSVVTGRLADDVMADDGVERFVGRKMWRPIME